MLSYPNFPSYSVLFLSISFLGLSDCLRYKRFWSFRVFCLLSAALFVSAVHRRRLSHHDVRRFVTVPNLACRFLAITMTLTTLQVAAVEGGTIGDSGKRLIIVRPVRKGKLCSFIAQKRTVTSSRVQAYS